MEWGNRGISGIFHAGTTKCNDGEKYQDPQLMNSDKKTRCPCPAFDLIQSTTLRNEFAASILDMLQFH